MLSKEASIFYFSLLIMTIAHMVIHVFLRIHTALFPLLREEFNLSLHHMGIIASIPLLCQALGYVPSGMLADRFGHRSIIALSFFMAGAASLAVSKSYNVLMLIFSLSALIFTSTLYHPAAYSLTSELLPKGHRAKALGVHGAGGTLGIALGPLSVSLFIGSVEWRSIYIFWALYIFILRSLKTQPMGFYNLHMCYDKERGLFWFNVVRYKWLREICVKDLIELVALAIFSCAMRNQEII